MNRDGWEYASAYNWLLEHAAAGHAAVWLPVDGDLIGLALGMTPKLREVSLSSYPLERLSASVGFAVAAREAIPTSR